MRKQRALISLLLVLASATCAWGDAGDLWQTYLQKDFFSLADRLPPRQDNEPDRTLFLRANAEAAFGQHTAAIADLNRLLARKPDSDLQSLARRLLMRENRADYRYAAALAAIEPLVPPDAIKDTPDQADLRNSALFMRALSDVAPQTVETNGAPIVVRRSPDGRVPVTVNGHDMNLIFDTGAAFSVLAESTAVKAGLEIRHVHLSVGSSTDANASASIAVGDVTFGASHIRNVVFLILPDAGLKMPEGFVMPGLIGFPVLTALGPIRYGRDGSLFVSETPKMQKPNLALDGNVVLVLIGIDNTRQLCQLDTGADNTVFYEPFYRRFPKLFTDPSRNHVLKIGSASGAREIPAYKLASMDFMLAGKPIHLTGPDVMTKSIREPDENYASCNIGMDALKTFKSYTIDLKHLRLGLDDGR
jgi:predicted aspartyl protease